MSSVFIEASELEMTMGEIETQRGIARELLYQCCPQSARLNNYSLAPSGWRSWPTRICPLLVCVVAWSRSHSGPGRGRGVFFPQVQRAVDIVPGLAELTEHEPKLGEAIVAKGAFDFPQWGKRLHGAVFFCQVEPVSVVGLSGVAFRLGDIASA